MFAFANVLQEDGKKKVSVKYAKDNLTRRFAREFFKCLWTFVLASWVRFVCRCFFWVIIPCPIYRIQDLRLLYRQCIHQSLIRFNFLLKALAFLLIPLLEFSQHAKGLRYLILECK